MRDNVHEGPLLSTPFIEAGFHRVQPLARWIKTEKRRKRVGYALTMMLVALWQPLEIHPRDRGTSLLPSVGGPRDRNSYRPPPVVPAGDTLRGFL